MPDFISMTPISLDTNTVLSAPLPVSATVLTTPSNNLALNLHSLQQLSPRDEPNNKKRRLIVDNCFKNFNDITASAILESSEPTTINRRLLSVLCKEWLIDLILQLSTISPEVNDVIEKRVEQCAQCRRLMVRNVSFTTDAVAFNNLFSQFGPIEDYTIVRDKETKKSRGFGFVTFKNLSSVRATLQASLNLDGRSLQIKLAAAESDKINTHNDSSSSSNSGTTSSSTGELESGRRKLFIRNLNDRTTTDTLRTIFREYGDIEDCVAVVDQNTGKGRGYGFITFVSASSATKALRNPQKIVDNQMVFLSYATSTHDNTNTNNCRINRSLTSIKPSIITPSSKNLECSSSPSIVYYVPVTNSSQHIPSHHSVGIIENTHIKDDQFIPLCPPLIHHHHHPSKQTPTNPVATTTTYFLDQPPRHQIYNT